MDQQNIITYFYNIKFYNFEKILWRILLIANNIFAEKNVPKKETLMINAFELMCTLILSTIYIRTANDLEPKTTRNTPVIERICMD